MSDMPVRIVGNADALREIVLRGDGDIAAMVVEMRDGRSLLFFPEHGRSRAVEAEQDAIRARDVAVAEREDAIAARDRLMALAAQTEAKLAELRASIQNALRRSE
jgi:hypothetical protein